MAGVIVIILTGPYVAADGRDLFKTNIAILIALSYPLVLLPLRFYLPAERRRLRGLFGPA